MQQKRLQQILIILGGVAFIGSTALGTLGLFGDALKPPKEDAKTAQAHSVNAQLEARERGYQVVLQREPDNQVALQGLVQTRIDMNNFAGAVEPMEKLVKLNPNEASYKTLLAELKKRTGKTGDR